MDHPWVFEPYSKPYYFCSVLRVLRTSLPLSSAVLDRRREARGPSTILRSPIFVFGFLNLHDKDEGVLPFLGSLSRRAKASSLWSDFYTYTSQKGGLRRGEMPHMLVGNTLTLVSKRLRNNRYTTQKFCSPRWGNVDDKTRQLLHRSRVIENSRYSGTEGTTCVYVVRADLAPQFLTPPWFQMDQILSRPQNRRRQRQY
jgi:hypothetical protein